MNYTGNCDAPLGEPDAPENWPTCQACGESIEPTTCSRCDGEGGSRSGSDDDGNAWTECERCYDGTAYECWSSKCKGGLRGEDGEVLR